MKKAFSLLLFLPLVLIASVQAEPVQRHGNRGQDGVVFAIRGSWDVGAGTIEAGIGYKHWISERLAIKSFLTFGKTDTTLVFYDDGYPPEQRVREKSFCLLAGVEDHIWKRGRLSFFYGGGIQFKTSSSEIDYTLYDPVPGETEGIRSSKNVFGIQSTLGVECFLTKRLSLSGQYQTDFSLEKESRKNILVGGPGVPQSTKQKITTWNLGQSTSAFMLTIYL
jgi:hypothetical protein